METRSFKPPGGEVERHLRQHGHLPQRGCCEYDQIIRAGDAVSFAHEDVIRKVTAVLPDMMVELEGMAGHFAMSLFRKVNYQDDHE